MVFAAARTSGLSGERFNATVSVLESDEQHPLQETMLMASGYEKQACGLDPNQGWGKPGRIANAVQLAVVVPLSAVVVISLLHSVMNLVLAVF